LAIIAQVVTALQHTLAAQILSTLWARLVLITVLEILTSIPVFALVRRKIFIKIKKEFLRVTLWTIFSQLATAQSHVQAAATQNTLWTLAVSITVLMALLLKKAFVHVRNFNGFVLIHF